MLLGSTRAERSGRRDKQQKSPGEHRPDQCKPTYPAAPTTLLNNNAVKFVHGDIDGDVYLENLIRWARECADKIREGASEIPEHLSQGDLYCSYFLPILRDIISLNYALTQYVPSPLRRSKEQWVLFAKPSIK